MLIAISSTHSQETTTTIKTVTENQQINFSTSLTHYVFLVDESGSMKANKSGWFKSILGDNASLWKVVKHYMKEFLKNAPNTCQPDDLISCVGFSSKAETRLANVKPADAHKHLGLWKMMGNLTRMNEAFTVARQMTQSSPKHKSVYIVLTDGCIDDFDEA